MRAQPLHRRVHHVSFAVVAHGDAEPVRADPRDGDLVRLPAQLEIDRARDPVLHLRSPPACRLEQPRLLDLLVVLVRLDAGCDERDAGVPVLGQSALGAHPVDPAGVGARVDHLGLVEQVEQEALVRRAALDDDRGLGDGPAQPGQRLVPGAPARDDLRDHGVEVGRDGVALAHTGVDADAGTGRRLEQFDATR